MSVGAHSVETRKLAFFVAEQVLLFASFVGAAWAGAHAFGAGPSRAFLLAAAALATLGLQAGLYLADLYDFKVAFDDAPRAARLLKAIGAVTIVCGAAILLVPGPPATRVAVVAGLGGACTVALAL